MNVWWINMQSTTSQTLQPLRKGGPNGIITLLLGLRWWHTISDEQGLVVWNTTLGQVHAMLKGFVNENHKRNADSS